MSKQHDANQTVNQALMTRKAGTTFDRRRDRHSQALSQLYYYITVTASRCFGSTFSVFIS
jgi:hypothetical protein